MPGTSTQTQTRCTEICERKNVQSFCVKLKKVVQIQYACTSNACARIYVGFTWRLEQCVLYYVEVSPVFGAVIAFLMCIVHHVRLLACVCVCLCSEEERLALKDNKRTACGHLSPYTMPTYTMPTRLHFICLVS